MFCAFLIWLLFSSTCQKYGVSFLDLYHQNLGGFHEAVPRVLTLSPHSVSSNLPKLPFKCFFQFISAVISTLHKPNLAVILCIQLWLSIFVFLSRFGGWQFVLLTQFSNESKKSHYLKSKRFVFFLVFLFVYLF